jgi:hypothetical protein
VAEAGWACADTAKKEHSPESAAKRSMGDMVRIGVREAGSGASAPSHLVYSNLRPSSYRMTRQAGKRVENFKAVS